MEKQECLFLQVAGYCKVTLLLQSLTFRDANFWKSKIWRLYLLRYLPFPPHLNVNKHNPGELVYMNFPVGKLLILKQSIPRRTDFSLAPPPPPHLSGGGFPTGHVQQIDTKVNAIVGC